MTALGLSVDLLMLQDTLPHDNPVIVRMTPTDNGSYALSTTNDSTQPALATSVITRNLSPKCVDIAANRMITQIAVYREWNI